jgi:hypothetical protein
MADSRTSAERGAIGLRTIPAPPPWEAFLLPVSGFPVPEQELSPVRGWLVKLTAALAKEWGLSVEVLIQLSQLHLGDGTVRLSDHGREWLPAVGLGVWPDREPPTLWTPEYFGSLGPGEMPRPAMYQVLRITTEPESRKNARNVMLGLGTILQILTPDDSETLLHKTRAVLHPPIKDPSYTCFAFYVPLFEAVSLRAATAEQLDKWFCGASVYIRESSEDTGILISSRQPLGPILQRLGGRPEPEPESGWRIPW